MRWSTLFIPTLRDDPAGADAVSHRLLLRAGFIRQLGAGIYSYLPLGQRSILKISRLIREEMDAIGGQEFFLPALQPAELWKESGRWDQIGGDMFRLRDRKDAELCLGMTHEEVFTAIARDELRSYRQLPQLWYQIQTKFRDEPRPKSGVLRGRQFTMKDSYSFDIDRAGLDVAFDKHARAYERIFRRAGLTAFSVEASSGVMGGKESREFMAISAAGEDWVLRCPGCGYAANLEKATSALGAPTDPPDSHATEAFATPGARTIEDLEKPPYSVPAVRQIKTLVYVVAGQPTLVCLTGDDTLCEVKLIDSVGSSDVRPAQTDEIRSALGALPGSLGAVGVTELPVLADTRLRGRRGMTTGANRDGFHLRHVEVSRDLIGARFADLREVHAGEPCESCSKPLERHRTIEVGHIFKLGDRYSVSMGARVLSPEGEERPLVMGSYGIGVDRILATAAEQHHDGDGLRWPVAIAPYTAIVCPVRAADPAQAAAAEALVRELEAGGFDVLLDDRDERPGVKFKDADLIGVPYRFVIGPRGLAQGVVELVTRASRETREIPLGEALAVLRQKVTHELQSTHPAL
jgi:prolyl-tRNA synthetase